jgi:hypothetical protein
VRTFAVLPVNPPLETVWIIFYAAFILFAMARYYRYIMKNVDGKTRGLLKKWGNWGL